MSIKPFVNSLHMVLKPHGFKRRGATWNRTSSTFIDVIDIQRGGDSFTINAGVFDPEVSRICWDMDPPDWVKTPKCVVHTRIGELIGEYDVWWLVNDLSAGHEIGERVSSLVLPFLDALHSRSAIIDGLKREVLLKRNTHYPLPKIYLAILMNLEGDKSGALTLLQEINSDAWRARIDGVFDRLKR